jgi:hypothetical protein
MKNAALPGLNYAMLYPEEFFGFLQANRYPVYHKSPIFFRDLQYGLWRFLQQDQAKVSYADVERFAHEIIDVYQKKGILRKINRQTFELVMPEFTTVFESSAPATAAAPKGKPAPASGPAANQAPAASSVQNMSAAEMKAQADASGMSAEEKSAKIAELQRKMAEAKARRLAGG